MAFASMADARTLPRIPAQIEGDALKLGAGTGNCYLRQCDLVKTDQISAVSSASANVKATARGFPLSCLSDTDWRSAALQLTLR